MDVDWNSAPSSALAQKVPTGVYCAPAWQSCVGNGLQSPSFHHLLYPSASSAGSWDNLGKLRHRAASQEATVAANPCPADGDKQTVFYYTP